MKKITLAVIAAIGLATHATAQEPEEYADMSDPLAVFNMGGISASNKGLSLKLVNVYDTGSVTKLGANVLEVQGIGGETLGWSSNSDRNNSIDSLRLRNFSVNTTNGRGFQLDTSWDFRSDSGSASYSLIQALPQIGPINLYPMAGAGVVVRDNGSSFSVPGTTALVGVYAKLTVTDRIWLNYNPMYNKGFGGSMSDFSQLKHEAIVSYQLNPRQNVRLFANWDDETSFKEGDFRIEFNHQF